MRKLPSPSTSPIIAACLLALAGDGLHAADQFWNTGGSGGSGIWGTSPGEKNWNTSVGAPAPNYSWPDTIDDVAVFQDATGGIVTVFDPLQANGIIQDGADYTINAATITLVQDSATTAPFIDVQTGILSIDSTLAGSAGMIKSGGGDLVLSAANSYTGTTSIEAGILSLTGSLASTTLGVSMGATFDNQSGGLAAGTNVTNAGTLNVNTPDTIGTYTQDGNGLLNGTNTLTTTGGATINGGEIAGSLLGNTTSTGNVLVSGTTGDGNLTVTGGSLDLAGYSNNSHIDIRAGELNANSGSFNNVWTLALQSGSTLTMIGDNAVATTTTIAGTLNGPGTFTAGAYYLEDGAVINGHLGPGSFRKYDGGTVTINGTLGSRIVRFSDGTLVLSGNNLPDDTTLDTTDPANPRRFSPAILLSGPQTVDTYTSNGLLDGPGRLTVTRGARLNARARVSGELFGDIVIDADRDSLGRLGYVYVDGTIGGGELSVENGRLTLAGTSANPLVTINNRTILEDSNGGLSDDAVVTVFGNSNNSIKGSLVVESDDTIATYISNSGNLSGPGKLTVTNGATLNGNSVIDGHLSGNITVRSSVLGAVVRGTVSGGVLAIEQGSLILRGTSTNPSVSILPATSLLDIGDLSDIGDVYNSGTLTIQTADTIGTYTSEGGTLKGEALLATAGSSIFNGASILEGNLAANGGAVFNDFSEVTGVLIADATFHDTSSVSPSGLITGNIVADGPDIRISGMIGGGNLSVNSGTLTLSGTSTHSIVTIAIGATVVDNGQFNSRANYSSSGTLTVNVVDAIRTYTSNGGLLAGTGSLSVNSATLNDGSIVSGNLLGDTASDGAVSVSGTIGGGSLAVNSGTLTLSGSSTNTPVRIAGAASLIDNGNLGDTAQVINNGGTLTVNSLDIIGSYTSNGGLLDGPGTLTARVYHLTDSSLVTGNLGGGKLNAWGAVSYAGTSIADAVNIQSGLTSLSGAGQFGTDSSIITVEAGARLDLGGSDYRFTTLQGTGTVGGELLVGPGDSLFPASDGTTGIFTVDGNLTIQGAAGNPAGLGVDVLGSAPGTFDVTHVTGNLTLGPDSSLMVDNPGMIPGLAAPVTILPVDGTRTGSFTSTNLATAFATLHSYNPADGTIQPLNVGLGGDKSGSLIGNLNENQSAAYQSLFEDVVDFGFQNVIGVFYDGATDAPLPPGTAPDYGDYYRLQLAPGSPLIQDGDVQLRDALNATPMAGGGLDSALVNLLLPEVHQGMGDFTEQAMRTQTRLATRTVPLAEAGKGKVFAAVHSTSTGSSASFNNADYDIKLNGVVGGMRYELMPGLQLGAMLGAVDGTIEGALVNTDGSGFVLGVFGEYLLIPDSGLSLFSSLSYGDYDYDATRTSFGGPVAADGIGSDALEFAIGIEGVAWEHENFRLKPLAALRYLSGDVDGFTEFGAGVPLRVNGYDIDSLLLELGLDAELDLNEVVTLAAHLGFITDFMDSGNSISSTYLNGSRPFSVFAPGIDNEALVIGVGATFKVSEAIRLGINWRSELRDSSQSVHSISIGGSCGF